MDSSETKTASPVALPSKVPAGQPTKPLTPPPSQSGLDKDSKPSTTVETNPELSASANTTGAPSTPPFSPSSQTPVLPKAEVPELDFTGNIDVNDDIPSEKDLKRVEDLLVLDARGQSRPFKELYKGEGVAPRQLIIFVRHFFCGNCQEYLRELSASITPEALLALPEPTFITVIGCGRPELIDMYTTTTKCPFPIYADPTRKLYEHLGMTRTLDLGKKPDYIKPNLIANSVHSIIQVLSTGNKALKGGDFKQVGGEFLFEDGQCVFAHRMRNTRDHMEVEELRGVLGLEVKTGVVRKRWSNTVKSMKEKDARESKHWGRGRSKSKGMKDKDGSKTPESIQKRSLEHDRVSTSASVPPPSTI
jgi:hypothetical protein